MKKKTTEIIVTRDDGHFAGIWTSKANPQAESGIFDDDQKGHIATFGLHCLNPVFGLFPSRPRRGQKKRYKVTVQEL